MTTYLHKLLLFALLTIASAAIAQSAEKTLVKSFPLEANQSVSLDLPGAIEVKTWDSELLRVQITITLQNGTEAVLKSLISAGRYNLIAKTGDSLVIAAPALAKEVQLGGKTLEDHVSFLVFAPKSVAVKLPTTNPTSQRNTTSGSTF